MNAIHIEALKFVDLSYEVYDLGLHEKSQRVLYIDPVCFELHGIHLNKNIDDALPSKSVLDSLIIPDISMGFNSGNYKLSLKNFKADFFKILFLLKTLNYILQTFRNNWLRNTNSVVKYIMRVLIT